MTDAILSLLGGIGLFLFGMQAMTNGLRVLAGPGLRGFLRRFTVSPLSGAVTGTVVTAILQSSSATIMVVIGFVGAGLMTFPQALGVVLGANVGTTVTGWMVALLGLKLHLGTIALPVLFVAALTAMIGRGRLGQFGAGLSGFAAIFIGLDMMQGAVVVVEPALSGYILPADHFWGRAGLVGAGFLFTAVTQSSGAGVAAVIVMLSGGIVDLVQGACLVIGMDVGTTVKAILSTLGGSRDMRRTAVAHLGYNLLTGVLGLALVGFVPLLRGFTGGLDTTALTLFHTLLNLAGVVLILPFANGAARLIERLVPTSGGALPDPLDRQLLGDPVAAIDAAQGAALRIASVRFAALADLMATGRDLSGQAELRAAIEDLEAFLSEISLPPDHGGPRHRVSALLHLTDHLNRLDHRVGQTDRIETLRSEPALRRPLRALGALLSHAAKGPATPGLAGQAARLNALIHRRSGHLRGRMLVPGAKAAVDLHEVFALTDALRWAERVSAHAERILHYAVAASRDAPTAEDVRGGEAAR